MIPYKHKAKKTFHPQQARKTFGTCKAVAKTGASISHLQQALSGNSSQHLLDTEKNGNTSDSHSDVYTNETVESDPFFPDDCHQVITLDDDDEVSYGQTVDFERFPVRAAKKKVINYIWNSDESDTEDEDLDAVLREIVIDEKEDKAELNRREDKESDEEILDEEPLYDKRGRIVGTDIDPCDCLRDKCPGCFFPCPDCKSNKCGDECRKNRTFYYEKAVTDGPGEMLINKHFGNT
ncbi:uncharacterized protein LOC136026956 [Artemia franciscana]|uniref:uncharacterized protein LOC136026956 n=1 Tax=Artemia franciscana TaxID=6661 RepID=UPI0032DB0D0E